MIGSLDQQITLRALTETADGTGGYSTAYADFATDPTPWAHVRYKTGAEINEADQTTAVHTIEVTIRNRADVSPRDGLIWDGRTYVIHALHHEGPRKQFLIITAEFGVAR